ncbi:MAG TPA: FAD-binding oxidoreductase [Gemmatimonadales bacterium]
MTGHPTLTPPVSPAARPDTALDPALADALRARLRGPVLRAGDPGYDDARAIWNGMIDRRPALIARCLGTADVVAAVGFAREHGLPLTVKSGGHNIAGLSLADGALTLDLSLMRGVRVDPGVRLAWAQAGCLLGDVDRETQLHGLAAPLGFVSTTGIAGLTLGGGFGYLVRRFGWTADNVVAFDVVTADARVVRASETENPELYWALRGGGGNFGVVTGFTYRLVPVGPEIVGGAIAWPAAEAPRVLETFRRMAEEAPPELAVVAGLRKAPPAPWLSPAIHGKDIVALFVCHSGDPGEGERLVAPLKRMGQPVGDVVQRRPYVSQQSLIDATQPRGRRYYWKSEYLAGHDPALLEAAVSHSGRILSPHSAVIFFPLDGAINRLPADHSPAGNRDARSMFNIAASWERPEEDAAHIGWARGAWEEMRRFSTGGTYVNFLTEDDGAERTRAAYGENFGRLARVKAEWDPENLLRQNKNIPPGA